MRVGNSTLKDCACFGEKGKKGREENDAIGRGGGIYLSSPTDHESTLPLGFLFEKFKFITNNATIGRDNFIVCFNLEKQALKDLTSALYCIRLKRFMWEERMRWI
jgi:hypothetical protein